MLAVIITIILSPGLDHIPGVLEDGPFPFFFSFKYHALFQGASEGNCAGKLYLWNWFWTLLQFVSISSFELCCPKLERPCWGVAASKNTVELVPW